MDELRWILLGVGVVIIGAVYYFGKPKQRPASPAGTARRKGSDEPLDPTLEKELERLGEVIADDRIPGTPGGKAPGKRAEVAREPERIVALYLQPKGRDNLPGKDIFRATDEAGLEFGQLNIFHRMHEGEERKVAIFSVANMTKPGDFDSRNVADIESRGLCLFLTLPNPLSALDAWDTMLATGQRLADLLAADLQDESHSSLSRQRIAHIREQMREYDRQADLRKSTR